MKVKLDNQLKNLCVCCDKPLLANSFFLCLKCGKACEYVIRDEIKSKNKADLMFDIKSKCCNSDVQNMQKATCSDECHIELVDYLESSFGKVKKVVDIETGIEYCVPTKFIIENGLNTNELKKFPLWKEPS